MRSIDEGLLAQCAKRRTLGGKATVVTKAPTFGTDPWLS